MSDFKQIAENTYYFDWPSKVGLYHMGQGEVCLIDSGNDDSAGKKIDKVLNAFGWNLKLIINTHTHADHIGGNAVLEKRYNPKIYSSNIEAGFIRNPQLMVSSVYGAAPTKDLDNKSLHAKPSNAMDISGAILPEGMEIISLPGHSFDMIGVKTPDDIWFLGDCLNGDYTMNKYHITFVYDVKKAMETFDFLETLHGKAFIPAHTEVVTKLAALIKQNRIKTDEIIQTFLDICTEAKIYEDVLKEVFSRYNLDFSIMQHALVGTSTKAYLSYLYNSGKLKTFAKDNQLFWIRAK